MQVRCAPPLPCAPADSSAAGEPVVREARAGGGRMLLAIDDDPDVVLLLKENLADAGYRVVYAFNGADGLRLARDGSRARSRSTSSCRGPTAGRSSMG